MAISVPQTKSVSTHGLSIIASGKVVGGIFQFQHRHSLGTKLCYEFGAVTDPGARSGEPFDNVPGIITGQSVTIQRYDIYLDRFEEAFGTRFLDTLAAQHKELDVRATLLKPDGSLLFTKQFVGFYFTEMGTEFAAEGERVSRHSASANFKYIREL